MNKKTVMKTTWEAAPIVETVETAVLFETAAELNGRTTAIRVSAKAKTMFEDGEPASLLEVAVSNGQTITLSDESAAAVVAVLVEHIAARNRLAPTGITRDEIGRLTAEGQALAAAIADGCTTREEFAEFVVRLA